MDTLHWQLAVLGKAVHYKNLSSAAIHVGLSQPQLSRIVSRLESELNVVLLDRAVRRKSGWTPVAFKIAETYSRQARQLSQSLTQLCSDNQISQINIGTLEGLNHLASFVCHQMFLQTRIQTVEVDVLDLSELEERFERNELDLIFTAREPGRQKYKYCKILGYQTFDRHDSKASDLEDLRVFSPFEYSSQSGRHRVLKPGRTLLSNSLALRRNWIKEYGGTGFFPSDVRRKKTGHDSEVPVYLIGSNVLSPTLWRKFETFRFEC